MSSAYVTQRRAEIKAQPPRVTPFASEHEEQECLIQWWAYECKRWALPELALFAIPNAGAGAQRGQAGKMKAEGARSGIPDLMLAVARGAFHGLYVELKSKSVNARLSPEQKFAGAFLRAQGYQVRVCVGADQAMDTIKAYLGTP